jgi:hypothetical protein
MPKTATTKTKIAKPAVKKTEKPVVREAAADKSASRSVGRRKCASARVRITRGSGE